MLEPLEGDHRTCISVTLLFTKQEIISKATNLLRTSDTHLQVWTVLVPPLYLIFVPVLPLVEGKRGC